MYFAAGLSGFIVGFVGNIPVAGPVMAIILKKCLTKQFRGARSIALGSAVAEGIYAFAAFWGFGSALGEFEWAAPVARAVGAAILFGVGLHFVRAPSLGDYQSASKGGRGSRRKGFLLGFSLTAINPTVVASWSVVVTFLFGLELLEFNWESALIFSVAVAAGMTTWGAVMVHLIRTHQKKWAESTFLKIQTYLGYGLMLLGLAFLVDSLRYLLVWAGVLGG